MKTLIVAALVAGVAGAALAPVNAQEKELRVNAATRRLLADDKVHKELKLTEEQVKKIADLLQRGADAFRAMDPAKNAEVSAELKKTVAALKPEQTRRLSQLLLQLQEPRALLRPDVVTELKLTEEQTDKFNAGIREFDKQSRALLRTPAAGGDEVKKKYAELVRKTTDALVNSLSADQQKRWRALAGEPFQGTLPYGATLTNKR